MWCSMRFAANAENIRTKGRCVAWQPLTRETEEQKNIRTEEQKITFVLAAYRGNIRT